MTDRHTYSQNGEQVSPVGSNILVVPSKKVEVKTQSNLVIPDGQGGARRAPRGGTKELPRAAEFTIVAVGKPRDETETPLVKDLEVGMRIAIGNAQIIPTFVGGEQVFILDSLHIAAIVKRPESAADDDGPPQLEISNEK